MCVQLAEIGEQTEPGPQFGNRGFELFGARLACPVPPGSCTSHLARFLEMSIPDIDHRTLFLTDIYWKASGFTTGGCGTGVHQAGEDGIAKGRARSPLRAALVGRRAMVCIRRRAEDCAPAFCELMHPWAVNGLLPDERNTGSTCSHPVLLLCCCYEACFFASLALALAAGCASHHTQFSEGLPGGRSKPLQLPLSTPARVWLTPGRSRQPCFPKPARRVSTHLRDASGDRSFIKSFLWMP